MRQRLMCRVEVSRRLHPGGRVSTRQGFFCGNLREKWWINILLVRCVSLEAVLAILLSVPEMRRTEE